MEQGAFATAVASHDGVDGTFCNRKRCPLQDLRQIIPVPKDQIPGCYNRLFGEWSSSFSCDQVHGWRKLAQPPPGRRHIERGSLGTGPGKGLFSPPHCHGRGRKRRTEGMAAVKKISGESFRLSLEGDFTLVQEKNTVSQRQDIRHPVLRHDQGPPRLAVDAAEHTEEMGDRDRIKPCRRFVQDQDVRVHDQRRCKVENLHFTSRQFIDGAVDPVADSKKVRRFSDPPLNDSRGQAQILKPEGQLVPNQVHDNLVGRILHDKARLTSQPDTALVSARRPQFLFQSPEQSRFPAPARPCHKEEGTGRHLKAKFPERLHVLSRVGKAKSVNPDRDLVLRFIHHWPPGFI